jgi:DtxR family Mn-dependent transcriptional regulator
MVLAEKEIQLSPALEDYLEAILALAPRARVSAIARRLGVAKASVTEAVKKLADQGFVDYARYGRAELTVRGAAAARRVRARHNLLSSFLENVLGVPPATAERDACILEHGLSAETTRKLDEFISAFNDEEKLTRSKGVLEN